MKSLQDPAERMGVQAPQRILSYCEGCVLNLLRRHEAFQQIVAILCGACRPIRSAGPCGLFMTFSGHRLFTRSCGI